MSPPPPSPSLAAALLRRYEDLVASHQEAIQPVEQLLRTALLLLPGRVQAGAEAAAAAAAARDGSRREDDDGGGAAQASAPIAAPLSPDAVPVTRAELGFEAAYAGVGVWAALNAAMIRRAAARKRAAAVAAASAAAAAGSGSSAIPGAGAAASAAAAEAPAAEGRGALGTGVRWETLALAFVRELQLSAELIGELAGRAALAWAGSASASPSASSSSSSVSSAAASLAADRAARAWRWRAVLAVELLKCVLRLRLLTHVRGLLVERVHADLAVGEGTAAAASATPADVAAAARFLSGQDSGAEEDGSSGSADESGTLPDPRFQVGATHAGGRPASLFGPNDDSDADTEAARRRRRALPRGTTPATAALLVDESGAPVIVAPGAGAGVASGASSLAPRGTPRTPVRGGTPARLRPGTPMMAAAADGDAGSPSTPGTPATPGGSRPVRHIPLRARTGFRELLTPPASPRPGVAASPLAGPAAAAAAAGAPGPLDAAPLTAGSRDNIASEALYTLRPVIYLLAGELFGHNSWRAWLTSLSVDLASLSRARPATPDQHEEVNRRRTLLLIYLLRSPFFDAIRLPWPLSILARLFRALPLVGSVVEAMQSYISFYRSRYFYLN